jgi:hypothetical protein
MPPYELGASGSSTSESLGDSVAPCPRRFATSGRRIAVVVRRPRTAMSITLATTPGSSSTFASPSAGCPGVSCCSARIVAPTTSASVNA